MKPKKLFELGRGMAEQKYDVEFTFYSFLNWHFFTKLRTWNYGPSANGDKLEELADAQIAAFTQIAGGKIKKRVDLPSDVKP